MKVIVGLGNPGAEYDATRHNVGWWAIDRLAADWRLGPFERAGNALAARGPVGTADVLLLKPLTYMNRSGAALAPIAQLPDFDPTTDLLVLVDDVAIDAGRLRLRPDGSAGGHNGLKSIESALGSQAYPRLRIGVGGPPAGTSMVKWVLDAPTGEEEDLILERFPDLVEGVRAWIDEDTEAAMRRVNG